MISARVSLDEYACRVLNVVKAKFGLKDKSEALNRFIDMYGDDYVEKEPTDAYVKKILAIDERHSKLHGKRKMSFKELDKLCGVR